jgi:DNA repair protein RecN (Recombination protein N)
MISKLRISNFALIESLELDLKAGFTILTGETGSGKSILLNAFSFIMGERTSVSIVGSYSKKAIVEVHIQSRPEEKTFFESHNLDYEPVTIVRRELVKGGKSRAFINDSPVSLTVLKKFTHGKILIHSQYNTYELRSKKTQLELYDLLAGLQDEVERYSDSYRNYIALKEKLNELQVDLNLKSNDIDYNRFLLDELNKIPLETLNFNELEGDLFKLENAEEIKEVLCRIEDFNSENGIYTSIKELVSKLDKLTSSDSELNDIKERLGQISIELKELSRDSSYLSDSIVEDPEQKSELLHRLDDFNRLLAKHQVASQEELLGIKKNLTSSSSDLEGQREGVKKAELELQKNEDHLQTEALKIHQSRIDAHDQISALLSEQLVSLKLPHTEIEFEMYKGELSDTGITGLNLLFSANSGQAKIEIENAASGGELSRFMLALLKLISEKRNMPSILFDEIDSGVSGDVADKIGVLLKNMGLNTQLLVISHLPQVVSKAQQHLMVTKSILNKITQTSVNELNEDERVEEIARLMSGENVTKTAIETAKSLMN